MTQNQILTQLYVWGSKSFSELEIEGVFPHSNISNLIKKGLIGSGPENKFFYITQHGLKYCEEVLKIDWKNELN